LIDARLIGDEANALAVQGSKAGLHQLINP
jgi:hypothetical protein